MSNKVLMVKLVFSKYERKAAIICQKLCWENSKWFKFEPCMDRVSNTVQQFVYYMHEIAFIIENKAVLVN
jgi:hypothetical protein